MITFSNDIFNNNINYVLIKFWM